MSYEITNTVPVPENIGHKTKGRQYPFDKMQIGDSFEVEGYSSEKSRTLSSSAGYYCKKYLLDGKFVTRQTDDNNIRVWRVK